MNIVVVGNVLKDVYLNLDTRTEPLETDKNDTKWLNLSFNASEHHFFNRSGNLGGAAVSLEVFTKMGIPASISGSSLQFSNTDTIPTSPAPTHRYILIADGKPCYLVPSRPSVTDFIHPKSTVDYLFIDRSANLNSETISKITSFLDSSPSTKLAIYLTSSNNLVAKSFLSRAELIFLEKREKKSEESYALSSAKLPLEKTVFLSEKNLSYKDTSEHFNPDNIDLSTHLSTFSLAAATILGCLVLKKTMNEALKLARINIENSKINTSLDLSEMESLNAPRLSPEQTLELIASNLVLKPKGILAADESGGSIKKKFDSLMIPDTYEKRHFYRNILLATPKLEQYINGVILFDETARDHANNGQTYVSYLTSHSIIPGIKVDQGLAKFPNSLETYTKGLSNLEERLAEYYSLGLRFAKWRAAFEIRLSTSDSIITPTPLAIKENCRILAEYAKKCQSTGLVPIVEPEVVYNGYYSIDQNAEITGKILDELFKKLADFGVNLRACILKVNMVLAGKNYKIPSAPEKVGAKTAEVLKNHVPSELAGVVFLSGGQTVEQATDNLAEVEKNGPFPWPVTFSFARALQDPALYAWKGNNKNADTARQAFLNRLAANIQATKKAQK